jgi:EAL domain-containing protein (putative c-di-GMP-specific phosphodiesterase class I)
MKVVPFIQPICSSETGDIIGAEILMRLHDGRKYYSPATLIAEIEKGHEIDNVMIALMEEVALKLPRSLCGAPENFYITFNIYAPQLYNNELNEAIIRLRRCFSPNIRIVIEIVERSLPVFDQSIIDIMDVLRGYDIQFAIDDFGNSSSSLVYLENAGFSFLKMDKTITLAHEGKLIYQRLINSLVLISRELNMHLVAEGIETEKQRELLKQSGVNAMQGYLFAKPMPLNQFSVRMA